MAEHVRTEIANGVLTLTLNRPEKKNALTRAMYQALAAGINGAEHDRNVRCVLLQAEGDTFTAGNDMTDFADANRGEPPASEGTNTNPFIEALARATTPIVDPCTGETYLQAPISAPAALWRSSRHSRRRRSFQPQAQTSTTAR